MRLALCPLLLLLAIPAWADQVIEGRVTVVRDVDVIVVAGFSARLEGVDGPETRTRAGRDARTFINRIAFKDIVRRHLSGQRTHDRWIAVCNLGDQDLGALAILNGDALACAGCSGGRYLGLA